MSEDFRASGSLCLIVLTYVKPLEDVDAQMKAHVAWMKAAFGEGAFLLAGRQDPRVGGVILARGDRARIEAVSATDPFVTSGVATAQVIAFNASFAAPAIADLVA